MLELRHPSVDGHVVTPTPLTLNRVRLGKEARQRAATDMRRRHGWTKAEMRCFYDRLIHHEKLKTGRSVVDAIGQAGR